MNEEDNPAAKIPTGKRFGAYVVVKRLDEGGFGQVYLVEGKNGGPKAAMKAEPNEVEGGSAIKLEIAVLKRLNEDGPKPHIPVCIHAAKHKKFSYMIMTLLGENLKTLKLSCAKELMPISTWVRIAIQCVYSVKFVHDYGFVHRDIKPNNFVMGHKDDPERCRIAHILDFGLSRSFALRSKENKSKWVARRARGSAEFRGTLRYCSPSVHEKLEQGRRDDLWSLYYVLIELHCGLPWQTVREKDKIEVMKMHMSDEALNLNFPPEMHPIVPALRKLNCYQRPDYSQFYNALVTIMKRLKVKPSDPYEWEEKKRDWLEKVLKAQKQPLAWENADAFFKSDPIAIEKAPAAGEGDDKTEVGSQAYSHTQRDKDKE